MSDTKSYTTTRTLRHNGKLYKSGADIELDGHFSEPLLNVGAIKNKVVKLDGDTDATGQDDGGKQPADDTKPPVNLDNQSGLSDPQNNPDAGQSGDKTGKPAYDDITAEKIKEKLTELGIDFTGKTAKKDLYDLLPA